MKRLFFTISLLFLLLLMLSACGHDHSFGDWETVTDSTCSAEGIKSRSCECGESESAKIELKSHTVTVIDPIDPKCDEYGYTAGTYCSDCGKYIEEPEKIEPGHNYTVTVEVAPTCSAGGTNRYNCSGCDSEYSESVDALGHDYISATCTEPKTCKTCSYTVGLPLGHTVDVGVCERCESFVQPRIVLPEEPITAAVEITGYKTEMEITDLSYRFSQDSITFTFSAKKISDEGELTDGRFVCGFTFRLYDPKNNLIASDSVAILDLAVGESVSDKTFFVDGLDGLSAYYVLVIENYN